MVSLVKLPGYDAAGNAMVNFDPLTKALDAYREAGIQAGKQQASVAGANAMARGDTAAAMGEFAKIDPQLAMTAQVHPLKVKELEAKNEEMARTLIGGSARAIMGIADPGERFKALQRLAETSPKWGEGAKALKFDINDPSQADAILKAINDQALGPQDADKAKLTQAQIEAARAGAAENRAQAETLYPAQARQATAHAKLFEAQADQKQAGGYNDLHQRVATERELRAEFEKHQTVKDFSTVRDAYGKVQGAAIDKTAAGDISMIFAYMKMLDPTSVVREGEFATAQNATGVPDRVVNLYNQVLSGNRLNEEQRKDFTNQAKRLYDVHNAQYQAVRGQYEEIARNAKLDPKFVTTDLGKVAPGQTPYGSGPARPGQEIPEGQPGSQSSPVYAPDDKALGKLPPGIWVMTPTGPGGQLELRQTKRR